MKVSVLVLFQQLLLLVSIVRSEGHKFNIYDQTQQQDSFNIDEHDISQRYSKFSNESLLWGPYSSNLYFGVRPRLPRSLLSGLMWFGLENPESIRTMRHSNEHSDNIKKATWIWYDPRFGGRQIIDDDDIHVQIVIDFVKSEDGLSWGAKIRGVFHQGYEYNKLSLLWYSGLEGEAKDEFDSDVRNGFLDITNDINKLGYKENVKLTGMSEELGFFDLEVTQGPNSNRYPKSDDRNPDLDPGRTHHLSLNVPDDNVWRVKNIFMALLEDSIDKLERQGRFDGLPLEQATVLRDLNNFHGNLHLIQKSFEGNFEFDVIYNNALTRPTEKITVENINSKIENTKKLFDEKFDKHYDLQPPFNKPEHHTFGKEIISGLLGGLNYAYGSNLVDRVTVPDEESFEPPVLHGKSEGPFELFSFVPSRAFFPRGFYWDEGFHLLPILNFDSDLALEVIKSWFNRMDDDGWIAREQMLGPEQLSRVPDRFQVQTPDVSPPTLMLTFTYLLDKIRDAAMLGINTPEDVDDSELLTSKNLGSLVLSNHELLIDYTKEIYPKLQKHYEYFRKTQRGLFEEFEGRGSDGEVYRWKSRTIRHVLSSGLDDYPRAVPADIAELNIDLISWIGVMTRSMKLIAELLDYKSDYKAYEEIEQKVLKNIDDIHWSSEENTYCDVSVDEDDVNIHVCHKGYISLFPFITKLLPADETTKLGHILKLIRDPEEIWTDYGIRSLSKSNEFYGTDENYWRSPIWININYLILDALKHYHDVSAQYLTPELKKDLESTYHDLRINLVNNIINRWKETGYVWEQYDDKTGKQKGAKNFLGWTSTVLIMMSMPENL
ncbi:glycoside hydrolase [Scheffersomyces coipomensis]|uniref:glycoside hydrolase n=1 Tax=Scheffersomyces coipomensis TaxID=1788519 RepID=UPI00315D3C03